jgi:hypothetical protein
VLAQLAQVPVQLALVQALVLAQALVSLALEQVQIPAQVQAQVLV